MEFILKRSKGNDLKTMTLDEIAKRLGFPDTEKKQVSLEKEIAKLKKLPKAKDIEKSLDKKYRNVKDLFNLTHTATIEKDSSIKVGTVYFNTKTDSLRLKKKNGWVTII